MAKRIPGTWEDVAAEHGHGADDLDMVMSLGGTWAKYVHNFPAVIGGPPPKVKLRIQPGHLEAVHIDLTEASWIDRRDWAAYLTLWYSSCHIGHVALATADMHTLDHALWWDRLLFWPTLAEPELVYLFFPSTKTRPTKANRPWFTAIGRVDHPDFCAVVQLRWHFLENFHGDSSALVFTRSEDDQRHYTRTAFTEILRHRLAGAARHLGIVLDPTNWSVISFHKGSLQTAADMGTPGFALADMADHTTVDLTRRNYLGDLVEGRASRTAAIGGGFHGVSPLRPTRPPAAAAPWPC